MVIAGTIVYCIYCLYRKHSSKDLWCLFILYLGMNNKIWEILSEKRLV